MIRDYPICGYWDNGFADLHLGVFNHWMEIMTHGHTPAPYERIRQQLELEGRIVNGICLFLRDFEIQ